MKFLTALYLPLVLLARQQDVFARHIVPDRNHQKQEQKQRSKIEKVDNSNINNNTTSPENIILTRNLNTRLLTVNLSMCDVPNSTKESPLISGTLLSVGMLFALIVSVVLVRLFHRDLIDSKDRNNNSNSTQDKVCLLAKKECPIADSVSTKSPWRYKSQESKIGGKELLRLYSIDSNDDTESSEEENTIFDRNILQQSLKTIK